MWRSIRWSKTSPCRKIEFAWLQQNYSFYSLISNYYDLRSRKLARTSYQCPESAITAHFNCSFLLTLALKPETYIMTLLVPAWSKSNPSLIEIMAPYKFPMGSWSRTCASTIPWCIQLTGSWPHKAHIPIEQFHVSKASQAEPPYKML